MRNTPATLPVWHRAQNLLADIEREKRETLYEERGSYRIDVMESEVRERQLKVIERHLKQAEEAARYQ